MADIFVSYGREDIKKVQRTMGDLHKFGFDYWINTRNIKGGDIWTEEIYEAIDACKVVLFFMSTASTQSGAVRSEIQLAFEQKKRIIIVRLDQSQIPAQLQIPLAGIQWIDASDTDWKPRLVRALGGDCKQEAQPKPVRPTAQVSASASGVQSVDTQASAARGAPHRNTDGSESVRTQDRSPDGLKRILQITEQMCYNGDLSPAQKKILTDIYTALATMKKKHGEKTMSMISRDYADNMFVQASRTLGYYLLSLSQQHEKWPRINLSNKTKDESLVLLRRVQDEVLTSAALIKQSMKDGKDRAVSAETERIINSLHCLRLQFAAIDIHLLSGPPSFEVANELERHFDDLVYHLNKYILTLDSLGAAKTSAKTLQ